jgi:hypothetical protein
MDNILHCVYLASLLAFPSTCFGTYTSIFKGVHFNYIIRTDRSDNWFSLQRTHKLE